jgi:hypothetical protein
MVFAVPENAADSAGAGCASGMMMEHATDHDHLPNMGAERDCCCECPVAECAPCSVTSIATTFDKVADFTLPTHREPTLTLGLWAPSPPADILAPPPQSDL